MPHRRRRRSSHDGGPRRRTPPGAAPGTIHVDPQAEPSRATAIIYTPEDVRELALVDAQAPEGLRPGRGVVWINVDGLGDARLIEQLGARFAIHRLALEDVVNVHQRAKLEQYGEHLFFVVRMIDYDGRVQSEQLSLFLGRDWLLTFQERAGDCFDPVRRRLREPGSRLRQLGPDYLAYALVDAVVDHYYPVLERYGERLEELEADILRRADAATAAQIHTVKRELLSLRRAVWPLREAVAALERDPTPLVGAETRTFLRDVHDHTVQVMDMVETYRELAAGLMDVYLSMVSKGMNEIMKVLTVIATLFIPLSFIASLYGMNFDHMPELSWRWGYAYALALMAAVAGGLLLYFGRKGWLGHDDPLPPDAPDGADT